MRFARFAIGFLGVLGAVLGVASAAFAIIALLDGLWLTTLAFGVLAAVTFGLAYGCWIVWRWLGPRSAEDHGHASVEQAGR